MNKLMLSLIRHGKTEANEKHLYCGKSDIHLSENGINELNDIKSSIKYPECNKFFSSGAKRANETGSMYEADVKELQESHKQILKMMGEILERLSSIE